MFILVVRRLDVGAGVVVMHALTRGVLPAVEQRRTGRREVFLGSSFETGETAWSAGHLFNVFSGPTLEVVYLAISGGVRKGSVELRGNSVISLVILR